MATIKLTVIPAKVLKGGVHKIRISLHHKNETTYIVTRFKIDNLSQFKNGQVVKRPDAAIINTKLRTLLNEYQERLDNIKGVSLYSCKQLLHIIDDNSVDASLVTYKSVSDMYITKLQKENRDNYAKLFEFVSRYFIEYANGDIPLINVTERTVEEYKIFLEKNKKLGITSINMFLSRFRVIINFAIKEKLVKYESSPFTIKIVSPEPRDCNIFLNDFIKIKNSAPKEKRLRVARDLFCLSFYLGGINLIDLLGIDFKNKNVIEYSRTKSRNTKQGEKKIVITIPEDAKPIIKEWMNRNTGKLDFGYKFSYSNFSRYLTRSITKLAEELNIKEKVVYYSARKTFAQFASELGIPDGVIDYCLGHSTKSKGVIRFYTKVRQKQAEVAINRVIDYVNDPDKYKDYIEMKADIMMMRR